MKIFCCNCNQEIEARLTDGTEVYPHRSDLYELPFWKCDTCNGVVGCHHKTEDRTKPLGVIPSPEIKVLRSKIHNTLDPLWYERELNRKQLYRDIANLLGKPNYHTAELRTVEECNRVLDYLIETYYPFWNLGK